MVLQWIGDAGRSTKADMAPLSLTFSPITLVSTVWMRAQNGTTQEHQVLQAGKHMFYPIAIVLVYVLPHCHRNIRHMAIELVQEIDRGTTVITQDTRETVFLFQCLSVALQWGNAVCFLNTMNTE